MVEVNTRGGNYTPLLVALVCLVAIGLSGATLTSADTSMVPNVAQGPDIAEGGGSQNGDGTSRGREVGSGGTGEGRYTEFTRCIDFLTSPLVVLGIVLLYALFLGGVARKLSVAAGVLVGLTLVPPLAVGYFFLTNCRGGSVIGPGGASAGGIARGLGSSSPVPAWMLVPLVLGVIAVGAAVFVWGSNDVEEFETTIDEEESEADDAIDEVATAAGAAADRIDTTADVDNEVFSAWQEMTDHLEIPNPESSTTGEFAQAAIDAGMNRGDVLALKGLFDEVRYGQADPSEDREDRAVAVLRNIESAYGESTEPDETVADATEDGTDDGPDDASEGGDRR